MRIPSRSLSSFSRTMAPTAALQAKKGSLTLTTLLECVLRQSPKSDQGPEAHVAGHCRLCT